MVKVLESVVPSVNEEGEDILYSEVEEAIRSLKRHEISNTDRITTEMFQSEGESLVRKVHDVYCKVWQEEKMLEEWASLLLVPIPKIAAIVIPTE